MAKLKCWSVVLTRTIEECWEVKAATEEEAQQKAIDGKGIEGDRAEVSQEILEVEQVQE